MMLIDEPLPFIRSFIDEVDQALQKHSPSAKLSSSQKLWLSFCCLGIAVTNSVCWARFSRSSLGKYTDKALCWMFCHSKIYWEGLLISSVRVILNKYGITQGTLLIDDSDRQRSKSTKRIFATHKIKDKKTGGYFMGQTIIMLVLVTPSITIPVGYCFYQPDPEYTKWAKSDKQLITQGVPKNQRPKQPAKNPKYPSKAEMALTLLDEFELHFPQIRIQCILADALYGSHSFFNEATKKFNGTQVISQLKSDQNVIYKGKERPLAQSHFIFRPTLQTIQIRGEKEQSARIGSARLYVVAHGIRRFVIALQYEGETEYRYLVASDLSWRTQDIVKAYTLRWLVEVFLQDWKSFEGWGQLAKQFDEDGSRKTLILSLLLDHCLFFHPDQLTCMENKQPAYTVGSLLEKIKVQSLLQFIQGLFDSEEHRDLLEKLTQDTQEIFQLRTSKKHMANRSVGRLGPTASLKGKTEKKKAANKVA
ncbi:MAG: transposase [SAR324 cluster bacterium]|nr:transposase [SAR324 cluster bacterium]